MLAALRGMVLVALVILAAPGARRVGGRREEEQSGRAPGGPQREHVAAARRPVPLQRSRAVGPQRSAAGAESGRAAPPGPPVRRGRGQRGRPRDRRRPARRKADQSCPRHRARHGPLGSPAAHGDRADRRSGHRRRRQCPGNLRLGGASGSFLRHRLRARDGEPGPCPGARGRPAAGLAEAGVPGRGPASRHRLAGTARLRPATAPRRPARPKEDHFARLGRRAWQESFSVTENVERFYRYTVQLVPPADPARAGHHPEDVAQDGRVRPRRARRWSAWRARRTFACCLCRGP